MPVQFADQPITNAIYRNIARDSLSIVPPIFSKWTLKNVITENLSATTDSVGRGTKFPFRFLYNFYRLVYVGLISVNYFGVKLASLAIISATK